MLYNRLRRWGLWVLLIVMAPVALARPAVAAAEVDLALVLAVDVSSSMDADELALQRAGYVAAITDPAVLAGIAAGRTGRIAVAYLEWAGRGYQVVTVPWRVIDGAAAARGFADELAARPLLRQTDTSISMALEAAAALIATGGFAAPRQVIDISGDGPNTAGPPVAAVRDRLVAAGLSINGLPLILDPAPTDMPGAVDLEGYYRDCVTGGSEAFVLAVRSRDGLVEAIRRKLVLDIAAARPRLIHTAALVAPPAATDCSVGQKNFLE